MRHYSIYPDGWDLKAQFCHVVAEEIKRRFGGLFDIFESVISIDLVLQRSRWPVSGQQKIVLGDLTTVKSGR